jgi:hypothetical protein
MSSKNNINDASTTNAIIRDIATAVAGLEFGSVLIKVHNAQIVQIEVTQRKRFDDFWKVEKGGGI